MATADVVIRSQGEPTSLSAWLARRLSAFLSLRPRRLRGQADLGLRRVSDSVSLGRSPTIRDIEKLARKHGFRALLNLNEEGEPGETLSPNVEASWAHAFEMQHERVSFDATRASDAHVDAFLATLSAIAKPVYVHSSGGLRAAVLVTIHLGLDRAISGAQALAAAKALGIDALSGPLRAFAVSAVNERAATPTALPQPASER